MEEKITIKLFAMLKKKFPVSDEIDVSQPRRVKDIISDIGIPEGKATAIFIDGRHASAEDTVCPGQTLSMFGSLEHFTF